MQVALEDWRVHVLRENDYPFVMIGRTAENDGLAYIDLDMEQAILDAYAHLVGLGHQDIAFLTFALLWVWREVHQLRQARPVARNVELRCARR
jgi:DNA-binding LacI/PurR family transcriptional regulator